MYIRDVYTFANNFEMDGFERVSQMPIAKVFKSGNSQAIRLPKEFRMTVTEVELVRQGEDILIRQPKKLTLVDAFNALRSMPDDFFAAGRDDPPPQEREGL
jgi:antitoxin VapB